MRCNDEHNSSCSRKTQGKILAGRHQGIFEAAREILPFPDRRSKGKPAAANPSESDEAAVKIAEGRDILSKIKPSDHVVTLEIKGRPLSSPQLAQHIEDMTVRGKSSIVFVIGGSLGLSDEVSRRADFKLSFSAMTFPHQMMRVILLEQIYRSFKIIKNEAYHK